MLPVPLCRCDGCAAEPLPSAPLRDLGLRLPRASDAPNCRCSWGSAAAVGRLDRLGAAPREPPDGARLPALPRLEDGSIRVTVVPLKRGGVK